MPIWLVSLGLKLSPFGKWSKSNWKLVAIVIGVAGGLFFAHRWYDRQLDAADHRGFSRAEQQYKAAVDAANRVAANDQGQMALMTTAFGKLSDNKTQALNVKVQPIAERIEHEIAADPRYRDCTLSDGVWKDINSVRSTVDASIAASAPKPAGH